MNFHIDSNQDNNQDISDHTQHDNYFTISSIYTFNPNEQKLENGILNDYYILSKFPTPDDNIINQNEKQNLLNKKDNKPINIFDNKNIISKVSQTMNTYIVETEKTKKIFKKKYIGKKRKRKDYNRHDKYADDNVRRKVKNLVLNYTLKFINIKIKDIYKGNIGNGVIRKELVPLNHSIKYDSTIENNKIFINKTLKEIFSENISSRFKSYYFPNRNNIIINRLLDDKDEKKRLFFQRLFNIKFIQCVEAFSGADNCEELKGFIKFDDIKKDFDDESKYIDKLEYYLRNFEIIIKNRKGKMKKKQKIEENGMEIKKREIDFHKLIKNNK